MRAGQLRAAPSSRLDLVAFIISQRGTLVWARGGFGSRVPAAVAGSLCSQTTSQRGLCEAAVAGLDRGQRYYLWVASGHAPQRTLFPLGVRLFHRMVAFLSFSANLAVPGKMLCAQRCGWLRLRAYSSSEAGRMMPTSACQSEHPGSLRCVAARRLQLPQQPPDDADVPLRYSARAEGRCANVAFPRQPRGSQPSPLDPSPSDSALGSGAAAGGPAEAPTRLYPNNAMNADTKPTLGTGQPVAGPTPPADGALPGDGAYAVGRGTTQSLAGRAQAPSTSDAVSASLVPADVPHAHGGRPVPAADKLQDGQQLGADGFQGSRASSGTPADATAPGSYSTQQQGANDSQAGNPVPPAASTAVHSTPAPGGVHGVPNTQHVNGAGSLMGGAHAPGAALGDSAGPALPGAQQLGANGSQAGGSYLPGGPAAPSGASAGDEVPGFRSRRTRRPALAPEPMPAKATGRKSGPGVAPAPAAKQVQPPSAMAPMPLPAKAAAQGLGRGSAQAPAAEAAQAPAAGAASRGTPQPGADPAADAAAAAREAVLAVQQADAVAAAPIAVPGLGFGVVLAAPAPAPDAGRGAQAAVPRPGLKGLSQAQDAGALNPSGAPLHAALLAPAPSPLINALPGSDTDTGSGEAPGPATPVGSAQPGSSTGAESGVAGAALDANQGAPATAPEPSAVAQSPDSWGRPPMPAVSLASSDNTAANTAVANMPGGQPAPASAPQTGSPGTASTAADKVFVDLTVGQAAPAPAPQADVADAAVAADAASAAAPAGRDAGGADAAAP